MKPFNPETTVFTNIALDKIMPSLSPNAWKILCLAIRKTAGWADLSTESGRKESDIISISQFREGCGISSNDTVKDAIDECLQKGYLVRVRQGISFRYFVNKDYELTITDSVIPTITDSVILTVTDSVNTNSNVNSKEIKQISQNKLQTPAKKNGDHMNKEDYLASVKNSLMVGMSGHIAGYAHYTERLRPVVERMERYWFFTAPSSPRAKSYSFWVQSCGEILDGCAEFGVDLLDDLYKDWCLYLDANGGLPPYSISSPKSLISAVLGKAALMRGGNSAPFWKIDKKAQKQTMLDV